MNHDLHEKIKHCFLREIKVKKNKCRLLQFLFGALRNHTWYIFHPVSLEPNPLTLLLHDSYMTVQSYMFSEKCLEEN